MGDISELILSGVLCETCGLYMLDRKKPGYPRQCEDCSDDESVSPGKQKRPRGGNHKTQKENK